MDKFGEAYKATVAVFHGIIATWLFLDFSERKVNEFYFVILLVFFTVANLLVWHAVLDVVRRLRGARPQATTAIGIEGISYRPVDVAILSIIAALVGLTAAAIDRRDAVLRLGSLVADWHRTSSDSPFDLMMSDVTEKRLGQLDKRDVQLVEAAAKDGAYLRVFVKDANTGYEGYPGRITTKGDIKEREVVFTPACRFSRDAADPTKVISMQRIEGPGVFLRLGDTATIEIIDAAQSACAKLF